MAVKVVFGCFGMLVFVAAPLFPQETTDGPIGEVALDRQHPAESHHHSGAPTLSAEYFRDR